MAKRNTGGYLNAAEVILRKADGPMHYREITEGAIKRGLIDPRGYTPDATMRGQLNTSVKDPGSPFVKVRMGVFRLKR